MTNFEMTSSNCNRRLAAVRTHSSHSSVQLKWKKSSMGCLNNSERHGSMRGMRMDDAGPTRNLGANFKRQ